MHAGPTGLPPNLGMTIASEAAIFSVNAEEVVLTGISVLESAGFIPDGCARQRARREGR
jgi:hypothetical protein